MANGLAFAWGVPVSSIPVSGLDNRDDLSAAIRSAAANAQPNAWIRAAYDAEPHITKPNPLRRGLKRPMCGDSL